jgi:hypothetical protein
MSRTFYYNKFVLPDARLLPASFRQTKVNEIKKVEKILKKENY